MPMVTSPSGEEIMVPANLNGSDLRQRFEIPENRNVIVTSTDGSSRLVSGSDKISLKDGDQVEHQGDFTMGA
jgi:hypothetical protein